MPVFSSGSLLFNLSLFAAGFYILIKGSGFFVEAAASIARKFGIQEVIIGLTIVSIGTSLPELGTNIYAAGTGQSAIAFGNVVGSNIANILLVLATGAILLGNIPIQSALFKRDAMTMLIASLLLVLVTLFFPSNEPFQISRIEGGILLFCLLPYALRLLKASGRDEPDEDVKDLEKINTIALSMRLTAGLVMVFAGSKLIVDNVIWGAHELDIPETVISATIIAFGTSIPELAVTITGVAKKENDIAVGNIIGSCIFNILLVMSVSALTAPIRVDGTGVMLLGVMIAATLTLMVMMRTQWRLTRVKGILLLAGYIAFIGYNVSLALR